MKFDNKVYVVSKLTQTQILKYFCEEVVNKPYNHEEDGEFIEKLPGTIQKYGNFEMR